MQIYKNVSTIRKNQRQKSKLWLILIMFRAILEKSSSSDGFLVSDDGPDTQGIRLILPFRIDMLKYQCVHTYKYIKLAKNWLFESDSARARGRQAKE